MIFDAHVTKPVVDGQYGEVTVTLVPDDDLDDVKLALAAKPVDPTTSAVPPLGFLPDMDGYLVAKATKGAPLTRVFAVKPIGAEAGKTYVADITLTVKGAQTATKSVTVPVEARPEVYAMLGAAEHLRRIALGAYESFKQVGKSVHQGTALPETGGDPLTQPLKPESFQWALSMVERGVQLMRETAAKPKP
jgi:hypothetical protein